MKRNCINIICLLMVIFILSGCGTSGMNPETTAVYVESGSEIVIHGEPRLERPLWESDVLTLTVDEMLERLEYIVDAEFVGYYYLTDHDKLAFRITKIYRGAFDEANEVILVNPLDNFGYLNLEPGERPSYELGQEFLLFLGKHEASVYFPHNQYNQRGQYYLNESSEQWDEVHAYVEQQIAAGVGPQSTASSAISSEEQTFTTSENLADSLGLTQDAFVVKIGYQVAKDVNVSVVSYRCTVTQTLKGIPNNGGEIIVPFPEGSVKEGESYVVLLKPLDESSEIYRLVSLTNSVFPLEEAQQLPELAVLLENAVPYNAPDAAE